MNPPKPFSTSPIRPGTAIKKRLLAESILSALLLATGGIALGLASAPSAHATDGDPGTNPGQVDATGGDAAIKDGGPIQYATGNLVVPETDFQGKGEMALFLTRSFNNFWGGTGIFGAKWQSNFDYKLSFGVSYSTAVGCAYPRPGYVCTSPASLYGPLWAHLPDGRRLKYKYNSTLGFWQESTPSPISTIVRNADGTYTLTNASHGIETYSATGDVLSIVNAQNIGWTFAYDANNYLKTVTHTNGKQVKLTWTGNLLTQVTDQNGGTHTYRYNAGNLLSQAITNIPGYSARNSTYDYEDTRFPTSLTGKNLNSVRFQTFTYDANGYANSSSLGASRKARYTYAYTPGPNGNGALNVVEVSPLGRQTTLNFSNGLLSDATATGGDNVPTYSKTHTYDANGFDALVSDFNGNVTSFTYAKNGQLKTKVEAFGKPEARTTNFTWDPDVTRNRLTRVVIPGDSETDYTYDPVTQRVATMTVKNLTGTNASAPPMTTTYTYTNAASGMLSKMVVVGPAGAGDTTTYTYNTTSGDLLSVKNSLNQATTYGNYNQLGQPGQVTGPNGDTTVFTYDAHGDVVNVQTTPNGVAANTAFAYDPNGLLTALTTPDGVTETYMYDDTLHLTARSRAANGTISGGAAVEEEDYVYDDNEDQTGTYDYARTGNYQQVCSQWKKDPDGGQTCVKYGYQWVGASTTTRSTARTFDGLGRVWTLRGNNGQSFVLNYDANGNVLTSADSLGHTTTNTYDHLDRLTNTLDAGHGTTTYGYDAGGRVASVADPRNLITSYVYDGFGQLWAESSPDTGTVSFTWDGTGHRTTMKRADATVTSYTYDALRRVKTVTAGGKVQTFTYDTCANGKGRLCGYSDAFNGSTDSLATSYTPEGSVAGQTSTIVGRVFNTAYAYDNMGRTTGVTYPDGVVAGYSYGSGKLAAVTATVHGAISSIVSGLTYQPYAGAAGWAYGNGLVRGNNYDQDGRLTGISTTVPSSAVVQSLTYQYDADNQIHAVTNGVNATLSQVFGYDPMQRLTSATAGAGSPANGAWNYDADSNRSSQTDAAGNLTVDNNAPDSNELTSLAVGGVTRRRFTFDANGNRLTDSASSNGAATFHFDPFNRMDSSTVGSVSTIYHVDPLGRRIYKSNNAQTGYFVYGPDNNPLAESNASASRTDYLWMGGQIVGMVRNNTVYMVHTDRLGRPEIATDPSQSVVWRANNLAFDRAVTMDAIGGLNIGFPGQYFDSETNLWNNGFRDYDATVGRYVESDPAGLAAGINTFAYAGGNPVSETDATGLDPVSAVTVWGFKKSWGWLTERSLARSAFGVSVGEWAALGVLYGWAWHHTDWIAGKIDDAAAWMWLPTPSTYTVGQIRFLLPGNGKDNYQQNLKQAQADRDAWDAAHPVKHGKGRGGMSSDGDEDDGGGPDVDGAYAAAAASFHAAVDYYSEGIHLQELMDSMPLPDPDNFGYLHSGMGDAALLTLFPGMADTFDPIPPPTWLMDHSYYRSEN